MMMMMMMMDDDEVLRGRRRRGRRRKRGISVVRHLPLVLEVPGSIPARGEKNFGVRTRFL